VGHGRVVQVPEERETTCTTLPGLGISLPPVLLQDFWTMLAHYHGQIRSESSAL